MPAERGPSGTGHDTAGWVGLQRPTRVAHAPEPDPAADPVVSPADTIREKAQQIIDRPQSPYGGSESGEEAWHWTHDWLAGFARDVLALLAERERDRQQIARLTEENRNLRNEIARAKVAGLCECGHSAPDHRFPMDGGSGHCTRHNCPCWEFKQVAAVLAGEEDAGGHERTFTLREAQELVALTNGGDHAILGDTVPQDVWDDLHERGLVSTQSFFPGDDADTYTTGAGIEFVVAAVRAAGEGDT